MDCDRASKKVRNRSWRRLSAYAGLGFGALVLVAVALTVLFGDAILNGYAKGRAERAFAETYPGYALWLGELDYSLRANRLIAQSVALRGTNAMLKIGWMSLTGVRWAQLLRRKAAMGQVLAQASFEATNLESQFPQAHYAIRCARVRASVPGADLILEGTELRALLGDETFFAANPFRTTRFHVALPECKVSGLAYGELVQGKSFQARSVLLSQPLFEALVNRDKPVRPFVTSPLMVHEALASIRQPLRLDSLRIADGRLTYSERVVVGAEPGVLTFAAVEASVEGIANRAEAAAAILIRAQGDFMNAGVLKVLMRIPVVSKDLSLDYEGSLSAMDLPRLNAFLEIPEHIRIKSGTVHEASFEIAVRRRQ